MSPFETAWVARRLRPMEGAAPSAPHAALEGAAPSAPPRVTVTHERIAVHTERAIQFLDVTDIVSAAIRRQRLEAGQVTVQALHTTAGILVNEHEPLLLADFRRTLERVAPRRARYAHDDFTRRRDIVPGERVNAHAHCQALFVPTSATLAVAGGALVLGRWQRVFFVELDGPQARAMVVSLVGVGG